MNKRTIRLLAMALCLVMVFGLTACGSGEQTSPAAQTGAPGETAAPAAQTTSAPSGFVWKSEFMDIDVDAENGIQPVLFTDDGFYASGQIKTGKQEIPEGEVEAYEGQYDILSTVLYFVDKNGKAERLPDFTPASPLANTEGKKDFYSYCNLGKPLMNSEGNLIVLEQHGAVWYDGPEEAYGTDEQYMDGNYHNEQSYDILTLTKDGAELSRAPVDIDTTDLWLNIANVACDADGNMIVILDTNLHGIAPDGSIAWSIQTDYYLNSMITLSDGTLAVMMYGDNGPELRPVDIAEKTLGTAYTIPDSTWSMFSGDENYDFYYTSGLYLYGFKLGEEEPEKILNWMSCDINGDTVGNQSLNISSDGTITGVTMEYGREKVESQIFTLTRVPADSVPQKQILTVAQLEYFPNYQLSNLIVRFNRTHDNVRLEYKDYNEFNTPDDSSAGMTKFMTEVMAGTLPDILPTSQLPYRQLASKGLLEDLYPYIDADKDFGRDDFFANLLDALEVNGGLYQMVPAFSVETLVGAASIVGDTPGWTYDEFNAALAKMPEGCTPLDPYVTRDQVLSSLLYADMDQFVDWSTGKVSFDTDNFKQMLEFVKQFPAEYNWEEHEGAESTQSLIQQGKQMLAQTYLYGLDALLWDNVNFGGKATYIGWPTSEGVGSIMRFDNGYAISKNCSNKEAAWEFLHGMLTEEGQAEIYMIPANRNVFQKSLEDIMTPKYLKDANGNYLLDENGEKRQEARATWFDENGEQHSIYAMTQEQADEILEIISTCTKVASYDTSIYNIVYEQAQGFFAGQKTVDDVARLIQSKANIYVNEQR